MPRPSRSGAAALGAWFAVALCAGVGCGSDSGSSPEAPAVDLTGVWIGSYSGQGYTGPVLLDATQSGATVKVALELLGPAVAEGNVGVVVTGTVEGHRVSISVPFSTDHLDATESGGVLSGTIYSGLTLGWTVQRLETHSLRVSASRAAGGTIPTLVAAQGGALWILDTYDNALKKTDDTGAVVATVPPVINYGCQDGLAGCGDGLVCSDASGAVDRYDPATKAVQRLAAGLHAQSVTCSAAAIFYSRMSTATPGFREIGRLDLTGAPSGASFTLAGVSIDLAHDGTDLWALETSPHVVLRLDPASGAIRAAYQLPDLSYTGLDGMRGLAWDGSALWTIQTTYSTSGAAPVMRAVKLVPSSQ